MGLALPDALTGPAAHARPPGVVCQLVIGVRPGEKFEAHAWIEHGGHPLLPTLGYERLTVL